MKKSTRILSLVLALLMAMGSLSVLASAGYKNGDLTTYNDLDQPVYTTEQYAEMAMDEVDRMLAEENISVYVYVGTLDATSVSTAVKSVVSLVSSLQGMLGLLADAKKLQFGSLTSLVPGSVTDVASYNVRMPAGKTPGQGDLDIAYGLLDFLADNGWLFQSYCSKDINLGAVQSFIQPYLFDVKELAIGMIYESTDLWEDDVEELRAQKLLNDKGEYSFMDCMQIPTKFKGEDGKPLANATMKCVNQLVEKLLLGKWTYLNPIFADRANEYTYSMYEFKNTDGTAFTGGYDLSKYNYYGYVKYHGDGTVDNGSGKLTVSLAPGVAQPKSNNNMPASVNDYLNLENSATFYTMLENCLVRAYNYVLVPWLNDFVIRQLRKECGIKYDSKYVDRQLYNKATDKWYDNPDYNPNYAGEAFNLEELIKTNNLAKIFTLNTVVKARKLNTSSTTFKGTGDGTVIMNLNNILGDFINGTHIVTEEYDVDGNAATRLLAASYNVYDKDTQETYKCDYTWTMGDNSNLMHNIISLGRFILACTGDQWFDGAKVEGAARLYGDKDNNVTAMTEEELLAYLLRTIFNNSSDWSDIGDEGSSIPEVLYYFVERYTWQYLPQINYTMPDKTAFGALTNPANKKAYYNALRDKILTMLIDVAAYHLNQVMDTVYVNSTTPGISPVGQNSNYDPDDDTKTGLLSYIGDVAVDVAAYKAGTETTPYAATVVQLAVWGISTYGSLLALTGIETNNNYNVSVSEDTLNKVWKDLDTIINALIPIKSKTEGEVWIASSLAGKDYILKSFLLDDVIEKLIYNLDFSGISNFFLRNTSNKGALNKRTLEYLLVSTIKRVFDVLFPNTIATVNDSTPLDSFIDPTALGNMLANLLLNLSQKGGKAEGSSASITGRAPAILKIALPIVCSILDLDQEQEFGEMENYIPSAIPATKQVETDSGWITQNNTSYEFKIYNASKGVNTSYLKKVGSKYQRIQDNIYTYEIVSSSASCVGNLSKKISLVGAGEGTRLGAGAAKTCTVSGFSQGDILKIVISYKVYDENGKAFDNTLTNTSYTYVGNVAQDDSDFNSVISVASGYEIQYKKGIYLNDGSNNNLSKLNDYSITLKNTKDSSAEDNNAQVTGISITNPTGFTERIAVKNDTPAQKGDELKDEGGNHLGWAIKSTGYNTFMSKGKGQNAVYPFKTTGLERLRPVYQKDEKGNYVLDTNGERIQTGTEGTVPNGLYTLTVNVQFGGTTTAVPIYLNLYNDNSLESTTKRCISKNYSTNDIDTSDDKTADAALSAWNRYNKALENAISVALKPKNGPTFQTDFANNLSLVTELKAADEGINPYRVRAEADTLWDAIDALSHHDYTIQKVTDKDYYEQVDSYKYYEWWGLDGAKPTKEQIKAGGYYNYFKKSDFVYHTYKKYNDVKGEAEGLIRKGMYIVTWPKAEDYASEALYDEAYNKALQAAEEWESEIISNVRVSYLQNKLKLNYGRMIPIKPVFTKLNSVISQYNKDATVSYTPDSVAAFDYAKKFATELVARGQETYADINGNTRYYVTPSMVWRATEELIDAYKHLDTAADYTKLKDALADNRYGNAALQGALITEGMSSDDEDISSYGYIIGDVSYYIPLILGGTPLELGEGPLSPEEAFDEANSCFDDAELSRMKAPFAKYIETRIKALEMYEESKTTDRAKGYDYKPIGKSEQNKIDQMISELASTLQAVVDAYKSEGGDNPPIIDPPQPPEEPEYSIDTTKEYETSLSGTCYYPKLDDEGILSDRGIEIAVPGYDGRQVTDVLYGLPAGCTEDDINEIITHDDKCSVVISSTENGCGTGTIVNIVNNKDNSLIKSIALLVVGDCDGDGTLSDIDSQIYWNQVLGFEDSRGIVWYDAEEDDSSSALFMLSGDVDNDGDFDDIDGQYIWAIVFGEYEVCQNPRGFIDAQGVHVNQW